MRQEFRDHWDAVDRSVPFSAPIAKGSVRRLRVVIYDDDQISPRDSPWPSDPGMERLTTPDHPTPINVPVDEADDDIDDRLGQFMESIISDNDNALETIIAVFPSFTTSFTLLRVLKTYITNPRHSDLMWTRSWPRMISALSQWALGSYFERPSCSEVKEVVSDLRATDNTLKWNHHITDALHQLEQPPVNLSQVFVNQNSPQFWFNVHASNLLASLPPPNETDINPIADLKRKKHISELASVFRDLESKLRSRLSIPAITTWLLWNRTNGTELEGRYSTGFFNDISDWAVHLVLRQSGSGLRAIMCENLLCVAQQCEKTESLLTAEAIISGLKSSLVTALTGTRNKVNKDYGKKLDELESRLASLPAQMRSLNQIILKLVYIFDTTLLPSGSISWSRCQELHHLLKEMVPVNVDPLPPVQVRYHGFLLRTLDAAQKAKVHLPALSKKHADEEHRHPDGGAGF